MLIEAGIYPLQVLDCLPLLIVQPLLPAEDQEALAFHALPFNIVCFLEFRLPYGIQGLIDLLRDVELIEDDGSIRGILPNRCDVWIPHIHDDDGDGPGPLPATAVEESIQSLLPSSDLYPYDRPSQDIPYDRQILLPFFIGDFINAYGFRMELGQRNDKLPEILLVNMLGGLPVDSHERSSILQAHLLAEESDISFESLGMETVLIDEIQLFKATVSAGADDLEFTEGDPDLPV